MQTRSRSSRPHSILIVDDDPDILVTFTEILKNRNYSVESASSGKDFLEMARKTIYDVAIVDLKLPDIEGLELLREMKKISPRTKKIVITGYPTLESAIDAMGSGTDAYLLKPVEPEDFLKIVEQKIREKEEEETITDEKIRALIGKQPSQGKKGESRSSRDPPGRHPSPGEELNGTS